MWFKVFLKDLKWRFHNYGVKKTNFGTKLKINSYMDYLVFKEVFTDKIYDEFIINALKKHANENEPRRVFDIGANLGFFTVRCCEIWNQIETRANIDFIIYEPSENCIGRLKQNLKKFDQKNFSFVIRNKLVGKKNGSDWFIEDKDHHLGQCISPRIVKKGHRYSRKIDYYDLSKDLKLSNIDLLKCDIEGSEIEFLNNYGFHLDNVKSIIIETHGQNSFQYVNKKMKDANFKRFNKIKVDEDAIYSNLFFVKN